MPLKFQLDTLEGLPEAVAGFYTEKEGKFVLDLDGMPEPDGLKTALENERKLRRQHEKQVKAWEKLGKSPDEISELLARLDEDEEKRNREAGDVEKILSQKQAKWDQEKSALATELEAARKSERKAIIETSLLSALTKAGATEEGLDLLPDRLQRRIKFELDGTDRVIRIMAADGETPLAGSAKDGTATFDDLAKEAVEKFPSLFKGEGRGGSGMPPKNKAGRSGVTRKSDFKTEKDRARFVEEFGVEAYKALPA